VRLLLDSHVALWWLLDIELGATCKEAISSADDVFFSPVTPWELGIKRSLGKLELPDDFVDELRRSGFTELQIVSAHATSATALPPHHRDPFDRILIAQAIDEGLQLVTADSDISLYEVATFDAHS
jgi:PIN domain nuclease of toxin-antitoxin system